MTALAGKRVLVVEDEYFVAAMLVDALESEQAQVVGPVGTHQAGLALIEREHIDAAVIDLNLRGSQDDALGLELARRGIPYLIATGYGKASTALTAPILTKPFTPKQFIAALSRLL
jgi:CheY-like chemotaxis protein